ncbi:hypothetical protein, partial [Mycobacterium kyorinense]|uniref:hypothetical protein n=1 Tax=Mycobacterium kyorinense TaxID=487514 RepID=UPI0005EFDE05
MTGGLPGIKAEAQKVAANIGEAARRYAETDAAIAAKIRRLVFPALDDEPGQGHIQGVGFRPAPRGADHLVPAA